MNTMIVKKCKIYFIEEAKKIIELINSNFHKYNLSSKKPYKLSISIGYSIYQHNVDTTFDELIHKADTMLYDNKAVIKNSCSNG